MDGPSEESMKYLHISKPLQYVYNNVTRQTETIVAPIRGTPYRRKEPKNPSRRDKIRLGLRTKVPLHSRFCRKPFLLDQMI